MFQNVKNRRILKDHHLWEPIYTESFRKKGKKEREPCEKHLGLSERKTDFWKMERGL